MPNQNVEMTRQPTRYISVEEAMDRSPYRNVFSIYRAIEGSGAFKDNKLPAEKVGGVWAIKESDFEAWMESRGG